MPWRMEESCATVSQDELLDTSEYEREPEPVRVICYACGEAANQNDMQRARVWARYGGSSMHLVCENCIRSCHSCDNYFATEARWCYSNCPSCHQQIWEEENDSHDDDDDCDGGFYYPSTKFFGKGPKFFGLEIETEVVSGDRTDKLRSLRNTLGDYASLKDDGSLDYGIEIATQPASMSEHKVRLAKLFANVPRGLRSWNQSSCGLHIHVSRVVLSELAIAKTVCFVSANHNRRFIQLIAGRSACSYCKIQPKKIGSANQYNDDRYEAINLQNDRTIEFRLFKGTLRQASVFKALEFTDALTTYASTAARSIRDSQSRVQFCSFVAENAKHWPNLCAFIDARWFGRETELTKTIGFNARENNQETMNQTEEEQ
jgi:hypothetical protein